ncbi:hypothetical protein [Parafannyhessea umbonata]|uniref:hypothetical protein n=1 Tax=Parafannyhessea umbonata TaxID=604330 RepID=UPI0018A6C4A5|nr:hypothetical protein [Parafannyhessea umbonata]
MGAFALAIVAIMLMLLGIVIGARIGSELARGCVTKREYWMANLKIVLVGVLASAVIGFTRLILLAGIPIGAMAGAIATLKMDFGESVGPWKFHDRVLGVNKDQLRRAESGNAEAVRRARRDGTPMPEVISVSQKDADDPKGTSGAKGPRSSHKSSKGK